MTNGKSNVKKRNWAFIVYPSKEQLEVIDSDYDGSDGYGSVPDNWRETLNVSGLMYAISPLHDKDVLDDGSGKFKKPHYHVIVVYGSPTTYKNVKNLTDSLNSPAPQPLEQVKGYYRYFTHEDNPEKYQYDKSDIVTGGGFNILDFVEITKSQIFKIKFELQALIREQNFLEYQEFMDYIQDNLNLEEYEIASSNTLFFNAYLKSRRNRLEKMYFNRRLKS